MSSMPINQVTQSRSLPTDRYLNNGSAIPGRSTLSMRMRAEKRELEMC